MAKVLAFNVSKEKGVPKEEVGAVVFVEESGIEGDAHAGPGLRQVSLLASESADKIREVMPKISNGRFAENITTEGVDLHNLPIGTEILLGGKVLLRVTQIGKECHGGCAIKQIVGDCVMPREGIFARVLKGGAVSAGCELVIMPSAK
ncbi:MAG: MOSC domain-containing protein [Clostridiales bacterium]|nr:MOSC domain-containing protein [Clostridiales bacterium]